MKLFNRFVVTKVQLVLLVAVAVLSLTPLYGIAYLIVIAHIARHINYTSILSDSYIGRLVLSFVLFCITIMLIATVSWFVQLPLYPSLVLLVAYGIHRLLAHYQGKYEETNPAIITKDDAISLALAAIAPLIVTLSFFFPSFSPAASIQLLTRGYDNIAHLTFMRAVSDQKGYVYGPEDEVHHKTIHGGNAYPQGWHTASTNIVDGFGIRLFQSENPTLSINTYLLISCFWYLLTVYLFSKASLYLIRSKLRKFGSIDQYGVFALSNILIQLMLFWGCIALGFSNFIACIAYLLLLAIVFHDERTKTAVKIGLSALILVAISQVWLLPLPAVAVAIALYFIDTDSFTSLKKLSVRHKLALAATVFASILFSVFQAYIFLKFGELSTEEAINHDGGVFWISQILFGLIMTASLLYWFSSKASETHMRAVIAIVTSFLGMLVALFAYQIFTNEKTTYYFVKFLGLGLGVIGIYFVSASTLYICGQDSWKNVKKMIIPMTLASVSIFALAVVGTGQTTAAFNSLFQRYSILNTPTATAITDYIASDNYKKGNQIVILRGESYAEDNVGTYIANRVRHVPDLCVNNINAKEASIEDRIHGLIKCANKSNQPIVVVTSELSNSIVTALARNDLLVVNAPR